MKINARRAGPVRTKSNGKVTLSVPDDLIAIAREYDINLSDLLRRAIEGELDALDRAMERVA